MLKLGSLFDGIGGFPLAGSRFGIKPVWASEIEPWPIKVTEKHFPGMKHLGDITQINGGEIEPVDIIIFGSPCQDLSIAGKREGLAGERSGLFMEAVRIIREMRRATGGKYPRFAVWENVPGAFSSNKGEDFRAVIEEIAETEIPMPPSGKWATAGMVRTATADIAWRTIDAQHWGVPQRRRRIFLVADFTGQCAAEILFKPEGLRRNFAESGEAREDAAATVGNGIETAIPINTQIATRHNKLGRGTGFGIGEDGDPSFTLQEAHSHAVCCKTVVLADQGGSVMSVHNDISPTLRAQEHGHQPIVMREVSRTLRAEAGAPKHEADWESLIIEPRSQDGVCRIHDDGIVPTLNTAQGGQRQPCVLAFTQNQRDEIRDLNDKAGALAAKPGMKQQTFIIQNATRGKPQNGLGISQNDVSYTLDSLGNHAICLQGSMIGRADKNGPQGNGVNEDVSFTLNTTDRHAVAYGVDKKGDDEFAKSNERNAREILRKLREEIGTEAFAEWGFGILNSLQQAEILQPGLYGEALGENGQAQEESQQTCKAKQGYSTEDEREGAENNAMREMWGIIQKIRCTPQGQGHIQQFTRELNDIMQELPQFNSPAKREVPDMWRSGQGTRLLQQTLSSLQEIRRPLLHQVQYAVRRLTPTEALRLQGFPDWWLDIDGMSDTQKYRSIGNSVAIPCVEFVMAGIVRVIGGVL